MTLRSLRTAFVAALTTLVLLAGVGVARAQEGPIDHLRHRTHQIVYVAHRAIRHDRPVVVYVPEHRRHYYRHRFYDHRHHRYYYRYYRYRRY